LPDLDPARVELLRDLVGEWLAVEAQRRQRELDGEREEE
jgi:hypothetical protein